MVVRTRLRAILFPVVFYALSGVASAYFVQTALNGERGLKTKDEYKRQIFALRQDFDKLKTERAQWQHRVILMQSSTLDLDLASEEARSKLDYVDPRDLVIFTDPVRQR
ncbi:MAG TPA: septum formation initiator family protein [Lichenihabitans sp.]|jgi:cell division protein FtsB|nr:septum formation initiator family protein [Lichenihabitans sp.]